MRFVGACIPRSRGHRLRANVLPPGAHSAISCIVTRLSRAEAIYFGPPDRACAGWLHRTEGAAQVGIVVCNPFGYEAICAHRSLRHFAESAAESGFPALRFDYDGTGDSAGGERDSNRLDAWVRSTEEAVRTLRAATGVTRVWLVGVRLGVLIATLAAKSAAVDGIVAIAPVVSGKVYLRELKLLQAALGLGERPVDVVTDSDVGEGGQEALGFAIHADTRAAISKIDLTKVDIGGALEVLILDRVDLPSAGSWTEHLRSQGALVDVQPAHGYVEMMLDPHKAVVPDEMIRSAMAWLGARREAASGRDPHAFSESIANHAHTPRMGDTVRSEASLGDVREKAVYLDSHLYGVLSTPTNVPSSGRAIVLLNAGAIHHVGPNRLYVTLARKWAASGDTVLRLDISGLGESPPRPGEIENTVYSLSAVSDVGVAVGWLHKQKDVRSVWSVGLCAGAYHAFKSAVFGHDVAGIVAINPLTFFWHPGANLDFPAFKVADDAARYQRAAFDPEKWKKVLRGQVNVRRAIETVGRRATGILLNRLRDVSRRVGLPWKEDLGAELELLAKRSIAQRFIFASGDPGLQLLREQGGSAAIMLRKQSRLHLDEIDGPDHTFTPLWSHGPLAEALTAALGAPNPRR